MNMPDHAYFIIRVNMSWYSSDNISKSALRTHSLILWMVAFTGPSSTTSAPVGAMKRPSEVPPSVDISGMMPHTSATAS